MNLKGKTALVTGGGTGIGKATALNLAKLGANIVINYSRSAKDAEETLKEVEALGVKGTIFQADVSNDADVQKMVKHTVNTFGSVDILINNAGTTKFVEFHDLDGLQSEDFDQMFGVNAKGIFFTTRACAHELKRNKGSVVNVASIAGLYAGGSSIAYCASKAAAISITKTLAKTLAPEVRVNAVAPGIVMTRWVEGKEDHIRRLAEDTPLGRCATPEDVAEVIVSLVAQAGFVTGQVVVIDGGANL
ncbi:3-ketoacyl-ACP reductase [Ammoniphilus oxalaticus]|uniref:3-ketoacyl-ACP reductase n=1 Tax=Ammoniphilus oxalaticus TaxID=66863 RepID=A0A419SLR0_9BACL|nr:glucose 1-dehydrogenase [Ammoniphilus oxalaticus]RKD25010.1 3-ketoacyl-ACP reductase [Ammoniphilus oxalaticus]